MVFLFFLNILKELSIHFFQNSLLLGDIKLASAKTVSRRAIKFTDGGSFSSGFYF